MEYEREENVNTPEYWDRAHKRREGSTVPSCGVVARVAEMIAALPSEARVVEYGFGHTGLAERIGAARWEGRDFSPVAVEQARAKGFRAFVSRCGDSPGYRRAYLVAIEVLEHLDEAEMLKFLDMSQGAPHAFFSVPRATMPDQRFQQHVRGFGRTPEEFAEFLRRWWPFVEGEVVDNRLVAHCSRARPERAPVLTIGSSTLLDFHGVLYTFASLRTHHGDFGGRVEFLLADNHPEATSRLRGCKECSGLKVDGAVCGTCAKEIADMEAVAAQEGIRYIRWAEKQGTYPGKNRLKVEARSPWVLTMDSHVMLSPFAVDRCLEIIDANPECDDFYHFPNLFQSAAGRGCASDYRNQDFIYHSGTKSERGGVYGWTGNAGKAGDPYSIAAMITSCYLVRKDAWFSAKGYDPILGNYGGWEGPIQMKWWLMGRRVLSLRHSKQDIIDRHGFLHHWHLFCKPGTRLANQTGRVHLSAPKQRNFAASSAVIGGESWVRRHCELKGWNFDAAHIQEGLKEGMKLRPWMVQNLARPEWEDITTFFRWMRDEAKIPGALTRW